MDHPTNEEATAYAQSIEKLYRSLKSPLYDFLELNGVKPTEAISLLAMVLVNMLLRADHNNPSGLRAMARYFEACADDIEQTTKPSLP